MEIPAVVHFVSAEPLLAPITMDELALYPEWLIVGGESGPGFRPMELQWAASLLEECRRHGVAILHEADRGQVVWDRPAAKPADPPISAVAESSESPMIAITLDLARIDKGRIYVSKTTGRKYLSFVLIDSPDRYGNDGQVLHSISKEERLSGVKGEPCGHWRHLGKSKVPAAAGEKRPS